MAPVKSTSIALASLLALAPLAAQAEPVCSAELNVVAAAITNATFTNLRDQSNLLSKLATASSKAAEQKWSDAIAKLGDISDTATALAGAAKPKLSSADAINAAVLDAQDCLSYELP